jgi:beta-mannosidase
LLVSSASPVFIEESSLEVSKVGQTPDALPNESAPWLVNVTLFVRSAVSIQSPSLAISIPELKFSSPHVSVSQVSTDTGRPTKLQATFTIPEGLPQRWFPRNLGNPKLYNITTSLHFSSSSSSPSVSFTTQTGFRTITLVQAPYSEQDVQERGITPGDQWHFSVNGKAFFSSGTNIIPYDPFYARTTSEQVRWVLESAVLSGQNMVGLSSSFILRCD